MRQRGIPAVFMRGGTSKALMFDRATRECATAPTIQIDAPSIPPGRRRCSV